MSLALKNHYSSVRIELSGSESVIEIDQPGLASRFQSLCRCCEVTSDNSL
jgi:hypothetical protein